MVIIAHRINTIAGLKQIPEKYGVEIDLRGYGNRLLLNHDPIDNQEKYDELDEYLKHFNHAFIIFDIKEAGYEDRIIELAKKHRIEDYFLLDVEFPYLYRATRKDHFRKIAVRYSEAEPIEATEAQTANGKPLLDWVWIDTNTVLPLNRDVVERLKPFRTCLVCPDRWGRKGDIRSYIEKIKGLGFKLDAVMTDKSLIEVWEKSGVVK